MEPDDLLPPPAPAPAPVPAAPPSSARRITCDFCGCQVAPDGGVLRTSDRARALRDLEDDLTAERAALAASAAEVARLTEELRAAAAARQAMLDDLQRSATHKPFYKRELIP